MLLLKQPVKHLERGKVQRFNLQHKFCKWKAEVEDICLIQSQLLSGFNLLLSGYGSKYSLLTEFVRKALDSEKCLVVHGFNGSFKLTEFLHVLLTNAWNVHSEGMKQDLLVTIIAFCVTQIQEVLNRAQSLSYHLFIVIHSLDGVGLANKNIIEFFGYSKSSFIYRVGSVTIPRFI